MVHAAPAPGATKPTAAALSELLDVAREVAPSWEVVRGDWRALCELARGAHDTEHWRRAVGTLEATGERELARLWGVDLEGSADRDLR